MKTLLTFFSLLLLASVVQAQQPRVNGVTVIAANNGQGTNTTLRTMSHYGLHTMLGDLLAPTNASIVIGKGGAASYGSYDGGHYFVVRYDAAEGEDAVHTELYSMIGSGGSASSQLNVDATSADPSLTWDMEAFSTGDQRARFSMGLLSNDGGAPDADLLLGGSGGASWFLAHPTVSDGASAVAYKLATYNTLANATARLVSVQNPVGTEKVGFLANGNVTIPGTLYVGTAVITNGVSAGPNTNVYTAAINSALGSTNILINMAALYPTNRVRATLTANAGIMVTNVVDGWDLTLELIQDATGNRSVVTNATWGFNWRQTDEITGMYQKTNASTVTMVKLIGRGTNVIHSGNLTGISL